MADPELIEAINHLKNVVLVLGSLILGVAFYIGIKL